MNVTMFYIITPHNTDKKTVKLRNLVIPHVVTQSKLCVIVPVIIQVAAISISFSLPSIAMGAVSTNPSSNSLNDTPSSNQQWQQMLTEMNQMPLETVETSETTSELKPANKQNTRTDDHSNSINNPQITPTSRSNEHQSYQMPSVQELEYSINKKMSTFNNIASLTTDAQKVDNANIHQQAVLDDVVTHEISAISIFNHEIAHSINTSITNSIIDSINPDDYLPTYVDKKIDEVNIGDDTNNSDNHHPDREGLKEGVFKRVYNKIVHNGLPPLPKIDVEIYQKNKSDDGSDKLIKMNTQTQPMKNIEAALEDIYVDTLVDFQAGLPSIKKTAKEAAEAVGYYNTQLKFQLKDTHSPHQLAVIVESIGEPAVVENRIVDIRGGGENLEEFTLMAENLPPLQGDVFNQGIYESSKYAIQQQTNRLGFFDNKWLNKSTDVLLPDNTVDISLILDTGDRYQFGDVVFFTADPDTGQLTNDPDTLPVKPEILKQLLGFKTGEPYVLDKIDNLTFGLAATQYFNIANVEQVMPVKDDVQEVAFETSISNNNTNPDDNTSVSDDINDNINDNVNNEVQNLDSINNQNNKDTEALSPIDFLVDDSVTAKYNDIEEKAQLLLRMPDDRVLNEKKQKSSTIIGKLSDGISMIVKDILPDENRPLLPQIDNTKRPILADRITPEEVKNTKKVPLYVFVVSSKPYDAQFGYGYGTDTGFRTTATLENHLINRKGYQAGISGEWTNINKKIDVHASRPWKHPINDTLSSGLSYEETVINQGNGANDWQTKTFQAGIGRNRVNNGGWNRSYSARYKYDELDIGNDAQANPNDLPIKFNSSNPVQQAMLFGYSMNKTVANNLTNPTAGYRQYYSLEVGADNILTDTNMAIARIGTSGMYSFGADKRHQVIGRINTRYLWADEFDNVPYTLRFFAGGDQSIRGYDYNSLSPLNDSGYLTGGQILAVGSGEYNYEFKEGLRGAVFADIGNAYDSEFSNKTKFGIGTGIRWASPVGSVRLDVAAGFSEKEHVPIRLHLFIGSPL